MIFVTTNLMQDGSGFTSVASGTDNGTGFLGNKPTGKSFRTPPQACSLKFNKEGKAIKYTIGHVVSLLCF